ncbi:hypothetical protein [Novosphingobium sp.]|uniref:hypothetical protein n=1 Tax=Novosphingobium sp. TaxID=1874826 RepID=UPI0031E2CF9A
MGLHFKSGLILGAVLLMASNAALAQPSTAPQGPSPAVPQQPAVPTTKILAIGSLTAPRDTPRLRATMPEEVRKTVELYLGGKIDQWYVKQDGTGVVFILNVTSPQEAQALLEALPLGREKLMHFELTPLGPLNPLRMLLR